MRLLFVSILVGCAPAPSPTPSSPPAVQPPVVQPPVVQPPVASCPPLGTWTLTATATCATSSERHVLSVHAGPPDTRDPVPMVDVLAPVVVAGRTNDGYGHDRLLRITNPRATAAGCEMALHMEYVGPHETIEYTANITLASGRVRGSGTYRYDADDCRSSDPAECSCESAMSIDGSVQS